MENIEGRTGGTFNKQKGKIFRNAEDIEIIPSVNIDDITNGILISNDLNTSENKNNTNAPKTIQEIRKADLFIIAGTSLAVYPAASFIRYYNGKRMVLINRDETPYDAMCDLVIHDSLGKIFKEIEKEIQ